MPIEDAFAAADADAVQPLPVEAIAFAPDTMAEDNVGAFTTEPLLLVQLPGVLLGEQPSLEFWCRLNDEALDRD